MMKYLYCFDPGQTCGVVLLKYSDHNPAEVVEAVEIPGTPSEIRNKWQQLLRASKTTVVIEDWYRNNQSVDARMACYPVGMMQMLAFEAGVPVVMQPPRFRLSIGNTKARLKDYWLPNLKPHDDRRQALRHGLSFLVHTQKHLPTMEAINPR